MIANVEAPRSIVELGVFEGGSALILAEMFAHTRIEDADRLRIHYGVSQADEAALTDLAERQNSRVDLVVDDASHEYNLTRRSPEVLLLCARPEPASSTQTESTQGLRPSGEFSEHLFVIFVPRSVCVRECVGRAYQ